MAVLVWMDAVSGWIVVKYRSASSFAILHLIHIIYPVSFEPLYLLLLAPRTGSRDSVTSVKHVKMPRSMGELRPHEHLTLDLLMVANKDSSHQYTMHLL